jgi:ureidoglycolate lyase
MVDALPLAVEPLTAEAFAPFGEVIEASDAARHFGINAGYAERYHALAAVDTAPGAGRPVISIFRARPRTLPLTLAMLERHPLASQAFMPLGGRPYLVVVAPAGPAPDSSRTRCFLAGPGQGVNYARGTWHHPLLALDAPGDFLVVDLDTGATGAANCDEHPLVPPCRLRSL